MQAYRSYRRFVAVVLFALGLALAAFRVAWACNYIPPVPPCQCPCCCPSGCPTCNANGNGCGASSPGSDSSSCPVRYANGDIRMVVNDLGTNSASAVLGHTRVYSNRIAFVGNIAYSSGSGWIVRQWPRVVREGASLVVLFDPLEAYWFDPSGGRVSARYGAKQTLVYDAANHVYRMTEPDGTKWEFYDFSGGATQPEGLFQRRTSPGGQTVTVTACTAAQVTQVQVSTPDPAHPTTLNLVEQYDYGYNGDGSQLQSVALSRVSLSSRTLTLARSASYAYYGSGDPCGLPGDLKTVTLYAFDQSGNPLGSAQTYYYRYYTGNTLGGFAHGLKYAFLPQAYQNLAASLGHAPTSNDGDAAVAPFACYFFTYGPDHGVTSEVVYGQTQQYTFEYTNGSAGGPNAWARKTVERQLDANNNPLHERGLHQLPWPGAPDQPGGRLRPSRVHLPAI